MTETSPPLNGRLAFDHLLTLMNTDAAAAIPRRPFEPPSLPPGVYGGRKHPLAMDGACGGGVDTYGWLNAQPAMCGMGFPGYPYLANLTQRSEYRAPTEVIASELTREWIELTGASDKEAQELTKDMEDFGVRDCVRRCVEFDGFFGRGQLFVQIKGQEGDRARRSPLVVDPEGATLRKGCLLGFKPVEPIWTTPNAYNSNDPAAPDFYKPTVWYMLGKLTHASRLLTFVSRPVPDILKPSYNFGGLSLSQLIEPYVGRWLKTVDSVNRLISRFSVSGISTNMQSTLEGSTQDAAQLYRRAQLFTALADNRGLMLLDKDSEEFFQFNTPLTGLSELQAQAQEHMAAPTHIPLVKLTGITPSGLNASSDGEIKVFYDWCGSEQENTLTAHMTTILWLLQLNRYGKINPKIGFKWVPLDSPTDAEMAQMRKSDGDRDAAYVTNGIVSADEVRDRLRNDPNSGYTGLVGEAPEPPAQEDAEHQHELNEEGAENAAKRDATKADADHERAKEMAEIDKRMASDAWSESDHPRGEGGKFGAGGSARQEAFEKYHAIQQQLEAEERAASAAVKEFDKTRTAGSATVGGLIPDNVKASPEYKAARTRHDTAFARLRAFNAKFVTEFSKELRAARVRK